MEALLPPQRFPPNPATGSSCPLVQPVTQEGRSPRPAQRLPISPTHRQPSARLCRAPGPRCLGLRPDAPLHTGRLACHLAAMLLCQNGPEEYERLALATPVGSVLPIPFVAFHMLTILLVKTSLFLLAASHIPLQLSFSVLASLFQLCHLPTVLPGCSLKWLCFPPSGGWVCTPSLGILSYQRPCISGHQHPCLSDPHVCTEWSDARLVSCPVHLTAYGSLGLMSCKHFLCHLPVFLPFLLCSFFAE